MFLVSCGRKSDVSPVLTGVSFTAEMVYYNETYSCDCTLSPDGVLHARVTEPEMLEGFSLTVDRESVTADYLGISYTPSPGNMPFSSVIEGFYEALCAIADSGATATVSGNEYTVHGGEGASGYTLTVAPTGLPIKLTLPDDRFTVNFYNVTLLS